MIVTGVLLQEQNIQEPTKASSDTAIERVDFSFPILHQTESLFHNLLCIGQSEKLLSDIQRQYVA